MTNQDSAPDSVPSTGRAASGSNTVLCAPLDDTVESPKGFSLRFVDGRPWLRGYRCDDVHDHAPGTVPALRADLDE